MSLTTIRSGDSAGKVNSKTARSSRFSPHLMEEFKAARTVYPFILHKILKCHVKWHLMQISKAFEGRTENKTFLGRDINNYSWEESVKFCMGLGHSEIQNPQMIM